MVLSIVVVDVEVRKEGEKLMGNTTRRCQEFYLQEFKFKFFDNKSSADIIQSLFDAAQKGLIKAPEKEISKIELYISYAWKGESEDMADLLEETFIANDLHLIRDKNDLGYRERITEFMKRIGKAKGVVVIVSDKYLKSRYCMFELIEIYENSNFEDRIFPIVLGDANIFDVDGILAYKEHWKSRMDELNSKMVGAEAVKTIGPEHKEVERIHGYMDTVGEILKDMNSLSPEIHKDTKFKELIATIKEQF